MANVQTSSSAPGEKTGHDLDLLAINTIRTLAVDAVEKAAREQIAPHKA